MPRIRCNTADLDACATQQHAWSSACITRGVRSFPWRAPVINHQLLLVGVCFIVTMQLPWNSACMAQQSTMPAIADSPTAQALFEEALAQAAENPAESARIARRLLDEYGTKVIRIGDASDGLFASVSDETERMLLATPSVLTRFRDAQSRDAQRMLDELGPLVTAARRRLTPAGLVATILVAQRALHSDRPAEAVAALSRVSAHPDLRGAEAIACAGIEASARRRLGDALGADIALARLEALAADARINVENASTAQLQAQAQLLSDATAALASARATVVEHNATRARSPLLTGTATEIPATSWREIWSLDLEETLFQRLFTEMLAQQSPKVFERNRNAASWMTVVPTVLGKRIFVHEGQRVRAVDADSRDELWSRDLGGVGVERDVGGVGDLSVVAVDEGALVVYEGHAFTNARSGAARVWCLDPRTGDKRWSIDLDGHEGRNELAGLFPVGTPLLLPELIVVSARKPTQRLEQVDWLLALDRRDGSVVWSSSIAGAPGIRALAGRRHAGIVVDGASIVDATPLGAVASVRATDGAIEWLRRFPVPLREPRYTAEPWEFGGPAIAAQRIFVIAPDESEIYALNRNNGALLEAKPIGPGTQWESPRYLITAMSTPAPSSSRASGEAVNEEDARAATPMVLGVGSDIVAFDARDLSKRVWSFAENTKSLQPQRTGLDNRTGIRGRVSIAGNAVLVPGVDEFTILDLSTGAIVARIPGQRPANAVMADDRIIAAGDESLRILMPPARAELILRERLALMPDDPAAALALLDLAQATARPALAIEAARAAAAALARGMGNEAIRADAIERLIVLASTNPDVGDVAHHIASELVNTPKLRVRELLARGDFLRTAGRPVEAIECWRALAVDEALASVLVSNVVGSEVGNNGVARCVRLEALSRLARISARDATISTQLEGSATAALIELRAALINDATNESRQRAAFIHAHPRTQVAVDYALEWMRLSQLSPQTPLHDKACAESALRATLLDALVAPARVDLVDAARAQLELHGDAMQNARVTRRIDNLFVASGVDRAGRAVRESRLPRVGTEVGTGVDLRARLARYDGGAYAGRAANLALGIHEGALVRLSEADLSIMWRLRLDDRDPLVLWASDRIVLWQSVAQGREGALVIDASGGTVLYATPRAHELWPVDGDKKTAATVSDPRAGVGDGGVEPWKIIPFCDQDSLVLVRGDGDVARFALADNTLNPRTARAVLQHVTAASLHDGTLTLAGRVEREGVMSTQVVVLDPVTLTERFRFEPVTSLEVRWCFATALGEVFVGTAVGVERWTVDAFGVARPSLAAASSDLFESRMPTLLGASLMVVDRSDRPLRIPFFEGVVTPMILADAADGRVQSFRGMQTIAQGLLMHWDDRVGLLAANGEWIGVDSTAQERNFVAVLPTETAVLQVAGAGVLDLMGADPASSRVEYAYLVNALSPEHGLRLTNEGFAVSTSKVDRAMVIDGWLLLSSTRGTAAVALPAVSPPLQAVSAVAPGDGVAPHAVNSTATPAHAKTTP